MNNTINHRQYLHQIPEVANNEFKTKAYILEILKPLKCEIIEVLDTGVIAYFNFNKKQTIAFRADIDALKTTEETNHKFASKHHGYMHACGHDAHMAMLLGFAERINELEQTNINNNILLVFQPAEESFGGAKRICDLKILQNLNTKLIFGFHVHPCLKKGEIGTRPNEFMAKVSTVKFTVNGRSSHAAEPENGIDPNEIVAKLLLKLYDMERNEISKDDLRILKFGMIYGGSVKNILPDKAYLEGTYRCFSQEVFDFMIKRTYEIINELNNEYGCTIDLDYDDGYPALINDAKVYDTLKNIIDIKTFEKPFMISEDFSYYTNIIKGCFLFIGTGKDIPLHNSKFDIDEEILDIGVNTYLKLINL